MEYEPVIGLEIHVQTKTKSKMFCGCDANYFNTPPNTHTCPTCLGLPGALPVPNEKAIELAVRIALALNCTINTETKFDRKNYFYPDLPKGYQITQYDQPIGVKGSLEIELSNGTKLIDITRVHQEEDTGKSIHQGSETLLDYNKSGVPLVEIVTEPDFRSGEEVVAFARTLRLILRYLGVSDADMEKGQMRIEPNISVRKKGQTGLPPYKVETKNIGSISVLVPVIEKEVARQIALLENGETPKQETRGLIDTAGNTASQRSKEGEADYRYFPEPDIPPIVLDKTFIANQQACIPELPSEKKKRYGDVLGISDDIATIIVEDPTLTELFEAAASVKTDTQHTQEIAKLIVGDVAKLLKTTSESHLTAKHVQEIIDLTLTKKVSGTVAKDLIALAFEKGVSPKEYVDKQELGVISDESELDTVITRIISENPKAVEDVHSNPNAVMFLVGQVIKDMKGRADAQTVRKLIEKQLS